MLIQIHKETTATGLQTLSSSFLPTTGVSVVSPKINPMYIFLTLMRVKLPFQFRFWKIITPSIFNVNKQLNIISCSANRAKIYSLLTSFVSCIFIKLFTKEWFFDDILTANMNFLIFTSYLYCTTKKTMDSIKKFLKNLNFFLKL